VIAVVGEGVARAFRKYEVQVAHPYWSAADHRETGVPEHIDDVFDCDVCMPVVLCQNESTAPSKRHHRHGAQHTPDVGGQSLCVLSYW
jgi:hypothetical protein